MGEWEREAGFETWQKYEVTRHVQSISCMNAQSCSLITVHRVLFVMRLRERTLNLYRPRGNLRYISAPLSEKSRRPRTVVTAGQARAKTSTMEPRLDPGMMCTLCQDPFGRDENIVNSGGQVWHEGCFV